MIRLSSILRWTSLAAILFAALLRAQTTRARLPYWDLDPTRVTVPETALLYSHGFLLDALVWLAASAMIVGESLAGRRIHWKSGILLLLGTVGVALHGYYLPPPGATPGGPLQGDFMGLALGSAWAAALVGGWTILHLARDEQLKRAAALALFGFVAILVAKGAYQVYVEHAYTVSHYRKDPAAMLATQGLAEGSTGAKEYERRLFQAEAIGWFGLSNVYGTFVAASFIFFLGLSIGAWKLVKEKAISSGHAGAVTLATLASAFGIYLSHSKGALGAALAGSVILLLGSLSRRALTMGEVDARSGPAGESSHSPGFLSRIPPIALCLLPIALCLTTLAAVAARGLIGERLHELSLLFRWHYLVAATRIFASESLFGVGPMGFKNAYALHKVPINPEMVESPHSVFFDWSATLGAFGLCWCFVLIWLLLRVGRSLTPEPEPGNPKPQSWHSYAPILAATTIASATAWIRESPVVTADEWPLRLIALVVCLALIVIGTKIAALAPRAFAIALAAAATTVAVHSMIEMTPTQPGSCASLMLAIGLAVSIGSLESQNVRIDRSLLVGSLPLLIGLAILGKSWTQSRYIERSLSQSAKTLSILAPAFAMEPTQYVAILSERFGKLDPNLPVVQAVWLECGDLLNGPTKEMIRLAEFLPDAYESAVRLQLDSINYYTMVTRYSGDLAQDKREAVALMSFGGSLFEKSIQRRVAAANGWWGLGEVTNDVDAKASALHEWLRVTQLDPYSLTPALNAYRLARELNDTATARDMAVLALRDNAYLRLDPLKQLDAAQVADLERFLAETAPNPTQTAPSEGVKPPPPT